MFLFSDLELKKIERHACAYSLICIFSYRFTNYEIRQCFMCVFSDLELTRLDRDIYVHVHACMFMFHLLDGALTMYMYSTLVSQRQSFT